MAFLRRYMVLMAHNIPDTTTAAALWTFLLILHL